MPDFLTLFGQYAEKRGEVWRMDNAEIMDAYQAACEHQYIVGPRTFEQVFKPTGMTNMSDTQALLDAVELALMGAP